MKIKKITSLTAMLSFVLLIVNGGILFIAPQGRWTDWHLLGLNKKQWVDQHIIISVLFIVAIFLHTYYNWEQLTCYLENKVRQFRLFTFEFNIALIITVLFVVGAYFDVPPFSLILDAGTAIRSNAFTK